MLDHLRPDRLTLRRVLEAVQRDTVRRAGFALPDAYGPPDLGALRAAGRLKLDGEPQPFGEWDALLCGLGADLEAAQAGPVLATVIVDAPAHLGLRSLLARLSRAELSASLREATAACVVATLRGRSCPHEVEVLRWLSRGIPFGVAFPPRAEPGYEPPPGDPTPLFVSRLGHADPGLRMAAYDGLRIRRARALRALHAGLQEGDAVRDGCAHLLRRLGDSRSIQPLREAKRSRAVADALRTCELVASPAPVPEEELAAWLAAPRDYVGGVYDDPALRLACAYLSDSARARLLRGAPRRAELVLAGEEAGPARLCAAARRLSDLWRGDLELFFCNGFRGWGIDVLWLRGRDDDDPDGSRARAVAALEGMLVPEAEVGLRGAFEGILQLLEPIGLGVTGVDFRPIGSVRARQLLTMGVDPVLDPPPWVLVEDAVDEVLAAAQLAGLVVYEATGPVTLERKPVHGAVFFASAGFERMALLTFDASR